MHACCHHRTDLEQLEPDRTCRRMLHLGAIEICGLATGVGRLQARDVELDHLQHGFHHAFGFLRVLVLNQFAQHAWHHLPRQPEFVLQPAARLRLSAGAELFPKIIDPCCISQSKAPTITVPFGPGPASP